jgi:hemerythrin superfamily protein
LSQPSQQLTDDHASLDQLLKQLQAALQASDVETSHTRLDLFWARLAVHIRAEHLQLFPVVLDCMIHTSDAQTFLPALNEALSAVDDLREDHDFFMHELARAMAIIRTLSLEDQATIEREMNTVRSMMVELEKRLVAHNQLEEDKVYAWITTILNDQEQTELADRLRIELANRPPRFSPNEWTT